MRNGFLTKAELRMIAKRKKPGLQMDVGAVGDTKNYILSGTIEEFKLLREDLNQILDREETEVKRHLSKDSQALFLVAVKE